MCERCTIAARPGRRSSGRNSTAVEDVTPSPTTGHDQAGSGVRGRSARKGAGSSNSASAMRRPALEPPSGRARPRAGRGAQTSCQGVRVPESQVRNGLPAGGRWIRTIGPPVNDQLVETVLFDFPAEARVGDLNCAICAAISAGTITSATTTTASAGDGGRLKTAALLTGDRWFESCSLQRTVRLSPAATFERREPRLSARVCEAGLGAG